MPHAAAVLFRGEMNDEELIRALVRLDDAVKALENRLPAILAPAPSADETNGLDSRYADLEARHAALRERTEAAVDRLTRLLDPAQGS